MKTIALIAADRPGPAAGRPGPDQFHAGEAGRNTTGKKIVQKVVPKRIIKRVEEAKPIAEETNVALSAQDLKVAETVLTGTIKCELGASVNIEADPKKPGFFTLTHAGVKYRLHPVEQPHRRGAAGGPGAEAMWLQLGNKSMLMSQKQGLRLADECQAAKQLEVAEDMKKNPPKSLFESGDAAPTAKTQ